MSAKKYNKADGTQGTKWIKLGTVVQKDGKMFGDLDCVPTGGWFDGSIQLFEAEQQSNSNNQTNNQGAIYNQQQPQNQYNQQQQQYNYQQNYN